MNIIKCGTEATIKLNNLKGIITGISIRFNRVTYEISYFVNGDYKAIWMDECEFKIDKKEVVKIGFKN